MTAAIVERYGDFAFERAGGLCRLRTAAGLTFAASAGAVGSGIAGVDTLGVPEAAAPAGVSEQFLRLRFRSRGFFTAEPEAHLALGVMGTWRKTDPSSGGGGLLIGHGLIIGNVSGAPDGCREAPVVQIESFRATSNALLAGTCSPRLEESAWYRLQLRATRNGGIAYLLHDASGTVLTNVAGSDPAADVPPGLGGWWITHVFSDHHPERDWVFDIADLEIAWR
jgi:hypothetical protein